MALLAADWLNPSFKPTSVTGIAGCFCFRQDDVEPFDEMVPVLVVFKYQPPFYPTTNDVVQRSRSVYP